MAMTIYLILCLSEFLMNGVEIPSIMTSFIYWRRYVDDITTI